MFAKEAAQIYPDEEPLSSESLAQNLAYLMTKYQENKGSSQGLAYARQTLIWINRSYTYGVIRDGSGLVTKLRECQEEKARIESDRSKLQSDVEKFSSEVSYMKGRIIELERGRRIISRVGEEA